MYTNNSFCYVDLSSGYNSLLQTELPLSENFPSTFNQSRSKNYFSCTNCFNKNTYSIDYNILIPLLEEQLKKFEKRTIIIMDKTYDYMIDINKLIKISADSNSSVLFTVNKSLNEEKTIEYIQYLSDIMFNFKQNESGFSKDVDGILSIQINYDGINMDSSGEKKTSLRYSLKENTINFFTHLTI